MEFSLLPGAPVNGKPRSLHPDGFVQIPVSVLNDCSEPGERGLFDATLGGGSAYYQIGSRYEDLGNNGGLKLRYTKSDTWVGTYRAAFDDWYCDNDRTTRQFDVTTEFKLRCADPVCGTRSGIAVPALIGKRKADAIDILRSKGFRPRVRVISRGSGYPGSGRPQVRVGQVTLQYPSYGKRQRQGGRVLLYIRGERPGSGGPGPRRPR
jgi:hypothetical protein